MTTPAQLQHLATRMGLTAVLDASGGYDVVRVIVTNRDRAEVFDPANDAEQAMAVLCWLMAHDAFRSIGRRNVNVMQMVMAQIDPEGRHALRPGQSQIPHDNTPPSLRAAILAAALRVAGET